MLENLDSVPDSADSYLWADFAEFRALVHPDSAFSRGDLAAIAVRETDVGRSIEVADIADYAPSLTPIKRSFDHERKWGDLIAFVETRKKRLGDAYPFVISEDRDTLELKSNDEWLHRTYLTLLLSASLRHVRRARHPELTRAFEETSFAVFQHLMPVGSEVRATWAGGGPEAPYTGTLYQKMIEIAKDLRCKPNFDEDDFKETDTGDGGIDLIAWHPMTDTQPGIPISFAQCSCSRDGWRIKQLEASPYKHYTKLPVMHPWSTYYFLPLDLRQLRGGWEHKSVLGQVIIVDRGRLLNLMKLFNLGSLAPNLPILSEARAAAAS